MADLAKFRSEIDEIDAKIIELYERRMAIVKEIATYKIENSLPVLDPSREAAMLEKNLSKVSNQDYKKYYPSVLLGFLKASKDMQKELLDEKKE